MQHRFPYTLTLAAFVALIAPSLLPAAEPASRRPNFVFFLIDDLRHDAMSCAGHPFVRTPNIDRLAQNGIRFTNAFVTISLCGPSRACFLTGAYSHLNTVRTNEGQEFDPKAFSTFPMLLQKAGYETGFVGKWHMNGKTSDPRPGFDYWLSFKGQGVYTDPLLNENGREFKATGYMTDLLTDRAVAFLKKPHDKPFSLCVWHKAVHADFQPAERHKNLYADAKLPEPPNFNDLMADKPAWQREQVFRGARLKKKLADEQLPASLEPARWDPQVPRMIDYFRAEAAVDDSVGRVLATLRETGQLDNTYVIFTSDNGFFHGEHRRGDKRAAFEESIRIPFLVQGPGIAQRGTTHDAMVLNIDVPSTLLDLAGVSPAPTMQGRSLKPLLAGGKPAWRTSFLYEYYKEQAIPGIPTMFAVRTRDWKYVTYPGLNDIDELYDLRNDPIEMHNLAQKPEAADRLAEMKAEFERAKREAKYKD